MFYCLNIASVGGGVVVWLSSTSEVLKTAYSFSPIDLG